MNGPEIYPSTSRTCLTTYDMGPTSEGLWYLLPYTGGKRDVPRDTQYLTERSQVIKYP